MNKQLKVVTRTIFLMFIALFFAVTMIQVVNAESLRANPSNQRTIMNSFDIERGAIVAGGEPIAVSEPSNDAFKFQRVYSGGDMYAPVTGSFSRNQGVTGLEQSMNLPLSGTGSSQLLTRLTRIVSGQPPQGSSVELTIDPVVQQAAYEAMNGLEGAVVAIEPKTGKILALVSTPSYDPNLLASNNEDEIIANYKALNEDPNRPLLNRAIAGDLYHPGSTYKLLSAAAALESGDYTAASTFANPDKLTLPGTSSVMQNASRTTCGSGDKVSLETAIVQSCNIPFAELAAEMELSAIPEMAAAFGFGQELEIPTVVTPSVAPLPEDKAQAGLSSIGQLDVRSTPLQMAMVAAGIANQGRVMTPQLVESVLAPNLSTESEFSAKEFSRPISEKTAAALTDMMTKTVSDPAGTAHLAQIPGTAVAGKTGTAENGTDENGNDLPFTLWFTGFAPADDPQIAVAVAVADGGGAAHNNEASSYELTTAIGKRVMEAVFGQ
ncbi:peptidoglycan D,D-transpeptidase FtsI family protein [Leucobacter sp. M11]|uniref:peptidoglycan D,D-transpeptidase FtsI family protein n=1 Tax=Leucobacter sp. M11 TaxID=2993565 RepID=UPI002D801687|nr:penicillin-binding transpeptidase domain-containing protein [Leucobacter sp. M11]MEB4614914.1 penicillin-binding transpeptidase domain-containing protein [Leucobacter sp. M11]